LSFSNLGLPKNVCTGLLYNKRISEQLLISIAFLSFFIHPRFFNIFFVTQLKVNLNASEAEASSSLITSVKKHPKVTLDHNAVYHGDPQTTHLRTA